MTAALGSDTREYAWRVEQGERERLGIPVLDADDAAYDITGWTVDAKVKTCPGGTVLYTWPAGDITISTNTIELVIPAPVSALWTWTTAWWRVVISDPNSDVDDPETYRVIQGPFTVSLD